LRNQSGLVEPSQSGFTLFALANDTGPLATSASFNPPIGIHFVRTLGLTLEMIDQDEFQSPNESVAEFRPIGGGRGLKT